MQFVFYDESGGGFAAEQQFLAQWLPKAAEELLFRVGRSAANTVRVVLSTTEKHQERFPPDPVLVATLLNGDVPDDGAHGLLGPDSIGIATIAHPSHQLPPGVPEGSPVIALDIPSIRDAARRHAAGSIEAQLADVSTHELAHVVHGHATDPRAMSDDRSVRAEHHWHSEGEAQRDALIVLARTGRDEDWAPTTERARRALVSSAKNTHPAYQQFRVEAEGILDGSAAAPPRPNAWQARTRQWLAAVVGIKPTVEVDLPGEPRIGDEVFLADDELVVGPFVVVMWDETGLAVDGVPTEGRRVSLRQPPGLVARTATDADRAAPHRLDTAFDIAGWEPAESAAARAADIELEAMRAAARTTTDE
jgi:hypothetical protein